MTEAKVFYVLQVTSFINMGNKNINVQKSENSKKIYDLFEKKKKNNDYLSKYALIFRTKHNF